MPDRDVFDRNVRRGWQTAARLALSFDDEPNSLSSVIRALGNDIKKEGLPGFDQIVSALARCNSDMDALAMHDALERIRSDFLCTSTEEAVAAAKRLLWSPIEGQQFVVRDDH